MGIKMRILGTAAGVLAIGALLSFGGCVQGLRGLRFSHVDHLSEAECGDCHGDSGRADHAACVACHEIEESKPSEECLKCHTEGDYQVENERPSGYADVTFDHSPHEDVSCDRCHADVRRSGKAGSAELPSMALCVTCHDGEQAPAECSTCHSELRAEVAPKNHNSTWERMHGQVAQGDDTACAYCHKETGCEDCHKRERPRSHTPAWKDSGHGFAADHDRRACETCHQADECSRCHSMRPVSHYGAGFRVPLDDQHGHAALVQRRGSARSCRVCHETNFCLSCHPGGN